MIYSVLLADVSSFQDVSGEVLIAIASVFFIAGACVMVKGWFMIDGGNIMSGALGVLAGAGIAFSIPVMKGFFEKAGMSKAIPKVEYHQQVDPKLLTSFRQNQQKGI